MAGRCPAHGNHGRSGCCCRCYSYCYLRSCGEEGGGGGRAAPVAAQGRDGVVPQAPVRRPPVVLGQVRVGLAAAPHPNRLPLVAHHLVPLPQVPARQGRLAGLEAVRGVLLRQQVHHSLLRAHAADGGPAAVLHVVAAQGHAVLVVFPFLPVGIVLPVQVGLLLLLLLLVLGKEEVVSLPRALQPVFPQVLGGGDGRWLPRGRGGGRVGRRLGQARYIGGGAALRRRHDGRGREIQGSCRGAGGAWGARGRLRSSVGFSPVDAMGGVWSMGVSGHVRGEMGWVRAGSRRRHIHATRAVGTGLSRPPCTAWCVHGPRPPGGPQRPRGAAAKARREGMYGMFNQRSAFAKPSPAAYRH